MLSGTGWNFGDVLQSQELNLILRGSAYSVILYKPLGIEVRLENMLLNMKKQFVTGQPTYVLNFLN